MAFSLRQLACEYNTGVLRRGELLSAVNEHASESVDTATQVLTELGELRKDKTVDEEVFRLIDGAVRTTIGTTFLGSQYRKTVRLSLVSDSSSPSAGTDTGASESTDTKIPPGTVLRSRFIIDDVLGVGGMGTVYRGRDRLKLEARDRNPFVAIKVLNEDVKNQLDSFVALQREAARQQKLAHPNITTVYDFDQADDVYFLTMELLDGTPLDKFIKRVVKPKKGLSLEDALPMIRDMASALGYAHQQDLIHSDFKPGNCFITTDGRVKVFDFGIARAIRQSDHDDNTAFDGAAVGALTPAYASVEMLERNADPHPSDDVYALGCVAYELLAGRHPFGKVPATTAEQEDLVPKPIKHVKRTQNRALAHALSFRRKERTPDIKTFIAEFEGEKPAKQYLKPLAGAACLGVAALAVVVIDATMERKRVDRIIERLSSPDTALQKSALAQLEALDESSRGQVLSAARASISSYYADQIRSLAMKLDFDAAAKAITEARSLYPDSARIELAASFSEEERNRILAELGDAFERALTEGRLQQTENADELPDVITRARGIAGGSEILSTVRIENRYTEAVEQLVGKQELSEAKALLATAMSLVPDSIVLANTQDLVRNAEAEAEAVRRLEDLAGAVTELQNAVTLDAFLSGLPALKKLRELDSAHPALVKARERALPLLVAAFESRANPERLSSLTTYTDLFGELVFTLGAEAVDEAIQATAMRFERIVEESSAELRSVISSATVSAAGTETARRALDEWNRVAPADQRYLAAKREILAHYSQRADDARLAGQWDQARSILAFTESLDPDAALSLRLSDQRQRIAADEAASTSIAEAKQRADKTSRLSKTLEAGIGSIGSTADVQRLVAIRDELLKLGTPASELPDIGTIGVSALRDLALATADSGDYALALEQLAEAETLFPQARALSAAVTDVKAARDRQMAEQRAMRVAELRKIVEEQLESPPAPLTPEWLLALNKSLNDLKSSLGAEKAIVNEYLGRIEQLAVASISESRSAQRYARAEELIGAVETVIPKSRTISAEARKVAADNRAFEENRRREAEIARIEALKQNFLANVKARQIERASTGYKTLQLELKRDSIFLKDEAVPALVALYVEEADKAKAAGEQAKAQALVSDGLALLGRAPALVAMRTELESAAKMESIAESLNWQKLFGRWCGAEVTLELAAGSFTYVLPRGDVVYPVSRYEATPSTVTMYWSDRRLGPMVMEFGNVTTDYGTMSQLRGKAASDSDWKNYGRTLSRCD